jgi:hypothetical protein
LGILADPLQQSNAFLAGLHPAGRVDSEGAQESNSSAAGQKVFVQALNKQGKRLVRFMGFRAACYDFMQDSL